MKILNISIVLILLLTSCGPSEAEIRAKKEAERKVLAQKERKKALKLEEDWEIPAYVNLNNIDYSNLDEGVRITFNCKNKFVYTSLKIIYEITFETQTIQYGKVGVGIDDCRFSWYGKEFSREGSVIIEGNENKYIKEEFNTKVQGWAKWLGPFFVPMTQRKEKRTTPVKSESLDVKIIDITVY